MRNDGLTCGVVGCGHVLEQRVGGLFASCVSFRSGVGGIMYYYQGVGRELGGISAFAAATREGLDRRRGPWECNIIQERSGGRASEQSVGLGDMLASSGTFCEHQALWLRYSQSDIIKHMGRLKADDQGGELLPIYGSMALSNSRTTNHSTHPLRSTLAI